MNRSRSLTTLLVLLLACLAPPSASAAYGDLDATFGPGGTVSLASEPGESAEEVRIQSDGKILLGMRMYRNGQPGGWLLRLKKDGTADKSFGTQGRLDLPGTQVIADLELLADGRIAVLTNSDVEGGDHTTYLTLIKSNGKLDRSFASSGMLVVGTNASGLRAHSLALQGKTKLLLSGSLEGSTTMTSLMRLNLDGSVDTSFGNGGSVSVPGTPHGSQSDSGSAIAVSDAGEILLGIDHYGSGPSPLLDPPAIVKFTGAGQRVKEFGAGGVAALAPLACYGCAGFGVESIGVAANGNLVAVRGLVSYNAPPSAFIRSSDRLLADGTRLPQTYGVNDVVGLGSAGFAESAGFKLSVRGNTFKQNVHFRPESSAFALLGSEHWGPIAAYPNGSLVAVSEACSGKCYDQVPGLRLIRTLGPKGGRVAPLVRITSGIELVYRRSGPNASWLRKISGRAVPAQGLKRVEIAINRVNPRLLKRGRCEWRTDHGTKTVITNDKRGKCRSPHFMRARGTAFWRLTLQRPLPVGKYLIFVRAITKSGTASRLTTSTVSDGLFNVLK